MNHKSITFRCSENQLSQMTRVLECSSITRTELISDALLAFLDYASQEHIRNKNLFELVADIDAQSSGPDFARQV